MSRGSYVLVGYDGTVHSAHAVEWAATEARLRRLPLKVVHSWRWPYPISHIDHEGAAIVRRMGEHVLDHGVSLAERVAPGTRIQRRLKDGPAYVALMAEGDDAELIVIGSHGQADLPVASTALQLPSRARSPVLVVRRPVAGHRRVVVGVDGSAGSDAALDFAFEQAALRGWSLLAVYGCWEPGAVPREELDLFHDDEKLKRVCGARLERAVAPFRVRYPQVDAWTSLVLDPPREALFDAADHADLVVVGKRGHGTVDPLLLGATSTAMLQHAPCSVAVVQPVLEEGGKE
ncbi:UNVERIFIED_ORG: nucleotide-binding universal stress UspA family protein [Actinomadura viridilutea]|uniref:universal stress protein n=1 Tax=Actinomadura rubrobrunea TaxID=115335 RepID=UPI0009FEA089|nr:universal stress protein [Actinomadura rubrobrunea]